MMKDVLSMDTVSKETRLVQIEIPVNVKEKLDEIFAKDGTTTPQGLKMIATQIANRGQSPFTTMHYEEYDEQVSNEVKQRLREDELEVLGSLPDNSINYTDEQSLDDAFQRQLGI